MLERCITTLSFTLHAFYWYILYVYIIHDISTQKLIIINILDKYFD